MPANFIHHCACGRVHSVRVEADLEPDVQFSHEVVKRLTPAEVKQKLLGQVGPSIDPEYSRYSAIGRFREQYPEYTLRECLDLLPIDVVVDHLERQRRGPAVSQRFADAKERLVELFDQTSAELSWDERTKLAIGEFLDETPWNEFTMAWCIRTLDDLYLARRPVNL